MAETDTKPETEPPAPEPPAPEPPAPEPPADPPPAAGIEWTDEQRAEISRLQQETARSVAKRERERADAAIREAEEKAGLEEVERLKLEKTQAEERAHGAVTAAAARLVTSRAETEALAAGVAAGKVGRFLRLLDLAGVEVDPESLEFDDATVRAEVQAALEENPEFKAPGVQPGGDPNPPSGDGPVKIWTKAEVEKLKGTPEWSEHRDEILRQAAEGLIK